MLLTSTQVSFIVSTAIIVVFTVALFLAGYVLQQQTVRSLSAEIRPRMAARTQPLSLVLGLTLPPQFATATVPALEAASPTPILAENPPAIARADGEASAHELSTLQPGSAEIVHMVDQERVDGEVAGGTMPIAESMRQEPVPSVEKDRWRSRLQNDDDVYLASGKQRFDVEGEEFFSARKQGSGQVVMGSGKRQ